MRKLITLSMGLVFLAAIIIPATYFVLANDLPPLVTRAQVLHTLEIYVEGQRQAQFAGVNAGLIEKWKPLGRDELSEGLLAGTLAVQGCPDYFTLPKEQGGDWLMRVIGYALGNGMGSAGPGRCEMIYADRLSGSLGLPSDVHRAIAVQEIHGALAKEDLVTLELSSRYFAPGILGVASASKRLFGKAPRQLTLAESAELLLAAVDYDTIVDCKGPVEIRIGRNNVLNQMAAFNLVKKAAVEKAKTEKLHCLSRPG